MSDKNAKIIRTMVTALVIAEYKILQLVDGTKQDLKVRMKNAIASCRRVQDYFLQHPDASPETRKTFRQEFLGNEIVLLSELLQECFGMDEQSLEEIIVAIKRVSVEL